MTTSDDLPIGSSAYACGEPPIAPQDLRFFIAVVVRRALHTPGADAPLDRRIRLLHRRLTADQAWAAAGREEVIGELAHRLAEEVAARGRAGCTVRQVLEETVRGY